jgi:hypothetical protein
MQSSFPPGSSSYLCNEGSAWVGSSVNPVELVPPLLGRGGSMSTLRGSHVVHWASTMSYIRDDRREACEKDCAAGPCATTRKTRSSRARSPHRLRTSVSSDSRRSRLLLQGVYTCDRPAKQAGKKRGGAMARGPSFHSAWIHHYEYKTSICGTTNQGQAWPCGQRSVCSRAVCYIRGPEASQATSSLLLSFSSEDASRS